MMRARIVNFDNRAHPRVNAALILMCSDGQLSASRSRAVFGSTRWNKNDTSEIQALRRWNGITRNAVELVDKATAEFGDGRKRMYFAADIFDESRPANIEQHLARLIAPLVRILRCCQFRDEFVEGCVTIADTRTIAEHRIEGHGVTVVQQTDLLVALNGARTRGQT